MQHINWITGLVTEWKPGYVKVKLQGYDDGQGNDIVTDWLQIVKIGAVGMDVNAALEVNDQVQCIMDCHCEVGICLGVTSNEEDMPDDDAAADKYRVRWKDDSFFEYDKAAHKLTLAMGASGAEADITIDKKLAIVISDIGGEVDVHVGSDITISMKSGKVNITFGDGAVWEYDKGSGKFKMANGGGESLYKLMKDFLNGITALTVPTPAGNSSVPINVSTFTGLLTRLDTFLQ